MRYGKPLLIFFFLLSNIYSFAETKKILIAANESVVGRPSVIIESVVKKLENPPELVVASKLYLSEGDTLGNALKVAKELGIDYVLTFDFANELPSLVVNMRLAIVKKAEILKTFSFETTPENVVEATAKFTRNRIKEYLEKQLDTPAKTSILGEISLISQSGIIYLTMENNLLPPIGSVGEVCNNYMVKIGEVQITDIADDYAVAMVINHDETTPFEKGNIVKVTLGNNGALPLATPHDERYLICSECNGIGEILCLDCQKGYYLSNDKLIPCPRCQGSGLLPCEFCNSLGFVPQP